MSTASRIPITRRILYASLVASAAVHGVALVGLVIGLPLLEAFDLLPRPVQRPRLEVAMSWSAPQTPEPVVIIQDELRDADAKPDSKPDDKSDAESNREERAKRADRSQLARSKSDRDPLAPPVATLTANELNRRITDSVDDANQLSPDQQRDRLRQLAGQLNDVATDKSVEQLTGTLQQALGVAPRAVRPAEKPVDGEFDFKTAQLHDVRREPLEGGGFRYVTVLLDAAGRTNETELSAAEGEQLYKTWELIKANPLLEKVYRGIVMQLLDKLDRK